MLAGLWGFVADVGGFWFTKAHAWWYRKNPRDELLEALDEAVSFEEWEAIALGLDKLFEYDVWRETQPSKLYDYKSIRERLEALSEAQADEDSQTLVSLLRAGLVRNLGNITAPRLFNRAYGGTKDLIDQYTTQMCLAIQHIAALPTTLNREEGWTPQAKMDLMHDTRQAFGRSTLVLQGGAIFGLSHLGAVKALHLRGLLPRIITGTATGALIAALVCIHTENELLSFLSGDGVDLTAFFRHDRSMADSTSMESTSSAKRLMPDDVSTSLRTLVHRVRRYFREGYFLDVNVLESCVRANVGNLTFEEAFIRTKRVLNITVSAARLQDTRNSGKRDAAGDVPTLLNYLTAPNVLIWSAAVASNTSSTNLYQPATLYCKNEFGDVVPWRLAQNVAFRPYRQLLSHGAGAGSVSRGSPLARVGELFNVNHFIVSQARPYIAPFLSADLGPPTLHRYRVSSALSIALAPLTKLLASELHHRLRQLDALGLLGPSVRRLLLDETIPGAHVTVVPDVTLTDFSQLLRPPTKASLEHWILRGERAVWPAIAALRVRCAVEVELDRAYQMIRRRKPLEGDTSSLRPQSSTANQE